MDTLKRIEEARQAFINKWEHLSGQQERINKQIQLVKSEIAELDAAQRVYEKFQLEDNVGAMVDEMVQDIEESRKKIPYMESKPTMKQAVKSILQSAPSGIKAADIRNQAVLKYDMEIGPKTVGNILWQLKEDGEAQRTGHMWSPTKTNAPPEGEASNSAGTA